MKKKVLVSFLFITLFFSVKINAQVQFKVEYLGESNYRLLEDDKDSKIGDCKGSAIVYQASAQLPLSMKMHPKFERPIIWAVGLGGSYTKLDNKNFTGQYSNLVIDEIMNFNLNLLNIRPISEKWSYLAALGVGIYTPSTKFSNINFKNVMASGGLVFIYHLKPNLDLGAGIAINNSFGYPMAFPAIYLNYNTQGKFNLNVSMLEGLEVSAGFNLSKYFSINLVIEGNGQMALVEKDNENPKDRMFTHQYFVGGLRPTIKIGKMISIPITGGVNGMRIAEFSDRNLKSLFQDRSYYFQFSPYASVGLNIGF